MKMKTNMNITGLNKYSFVNIFFFRKLRDLTTIFSWKYDLNSPVCNNLFAKKGYLMGEMQETFDIKCLDCEN